MDHVHFNSCWEALYSPAGDVILVHAVRGQLRLRGAARFARPLLDAIHAGASIATALEGVSSGDRAIAVRLVDRLVEESVLLEGPATGAAYGLPDEEYARFRSFLAWLDNAGQRGDARAAWGRLREAHVTVIGAGGAGSLLALMLAACGIGELTVVDGDVVSRSNLVRQILFDEAQAAVGTPKVAALETRVRAFTPYTTFHAVPTFVRTAADARPHVLGRSLVVLTADAPRILLNREVNAACVAAGTPLIHSFMGQLGPLFVPGRSACFACLERHWRRESGPEHDEVVELMRAVPTREYPSVVTGPVEMANALCGEALNHVTRLARPRSMDGLVRIDGGASVEPVARDPECPVCQNALRSRP